jgi:NAD kinase
MERATDNKIILIKRKTRLEELVARFNTVLQAKFYIEHLGGDFNDYQIEDDTYQKAVSSAEEILNNLGKVQLLNRSFLPNYIFGESDLVVVLGQDGLVANTLKYLSNQRVVGVNPDPSRWDGVLLPFQVPDLKSIVPEIFKKNRKIKEVSMAKVILNDGQTLYAVNDLFVGQRTHVSARYLIEIDGKREQQSSSGIIISTGLGSTAWLKSILTGALGIVNQAFEQKNEIHIDKPIGWDSDFLYYSVREPFVTRITGADLVFGKVYESHPLRIVSLMPENGVIFSDGIENDFLVFTSGIEAVITLAEKKGHLVV